MKNHIRNYQYYIIINKVILAFIKIIITYTQHLPHAWMKNIILCNNNKKLTDIFNKSFAATKNLKNVKCLFS